MPVRAVEFYSGIGGMRLALEHSNVNGSVVRAFDFDRTACQVYAANHPDVIVKVDISTITVPSSVLPQADLWLISPPCQPYTILSLRKGEKDSRAKSFVHLIENVLPALASRNAHPQYLLIENVAGFETSDTRHFLLSTLRSLDYAIFECLLTPIQFGIPNSRLRYYLLAKFALQGFPHYRNKVWRYIPGRTHDDWVDPRYSDGLDSALNVEQIKLYLVDESITGEDTARVPDRVLAKWGRLFDIVGPSSYRSCCFTRGYTKLVEGAGSILQMNEDLDTKSVFNQFCQAQLAGQVDAERILRPLKLRYFTPTELLRLFSFEAPEAVPEKIFCWPSGVTTKKKYQLIGNSVNVTVISELINFLFQ